MATGQITKTAQKHKKNTPIQATKGNTRTRGNKKITPKNKINYIVIVRIKFSKWSFA
jgi:hypothetical protein